MSAAGSNPTQVMWITGASSGIGRATALEAARNGYKLALTARRQELLLELRSEIIAENIPAANILVQTADVTNIDQLRDAYRAICEHFGAVDILFANAGSHDPSSSDSFSVAHYKQLFDLNFFGALNCIEVVIKDMKLRKSGYIVGVSSVAGYRALPTAAAYGASKAALTYFLESLRFDLEKDSIAVTVVSPGFVRTPLTDRNDFPMPCIIEAEDAAKIILKGIKNRSYEIHFPKRFTLFLKLLRLLPTGLYHSLISRSVVR